MISLTAIKVRERLTQLLKGYDYDPHADLDDSQPIQINSLRGEYCELVKLFVPVGTGSGDGMTEIAQQLHELAYTLGKIAGAILWAAAIRAVRNK